MFERWGVVGFGVAFSCECAWGLGFFVCVCVIFIWLRINGSNK